MSVHDPAGPQPEPIDPPSVIPGVPEPVTPILPDRPGVPEPDPDPDGA